MKRQIGVLTASLLILSGCGTSQTASGDPGAIFAGAAIGGNVGGAIGGLIGDNNGGWRGGYGGSAIGTIIGTIAGAAIGNAVSAPKQEAYGYRIERTEPYKPQNETYPTPSVFDNLRIRNIRFIDDSRDHVISSGEKSKVIFEIMNEGEQTIYNVVPMVTETTGMKRIYISPPVMVEQIAPHNGVKYTATISAGERIKTGNVTIRVAVADGNGQQYDWQEFSLPTER